MPALAAALSAFWLFVALFSSVQADVPGGTSAAMGGGGVAFSLSPSGSRPYMTLQYPQHGHIFRRTIDIVVAVTVGNFTMPGDGSLMGFLNGCAPRGLLPRSACS
jgi:hypothetical protein